LTAGSFLVAAGRLDEERERDEVVRERDEVARVLVAMESRYPRPLATAG
jgi:hypothetical protein